MSNTPSELRHMLPCPFCGGDPRHDAHATDCYFMLIRKLGAPAADMSIALEALHAWNRRTPQPVVREPLTVYEIHESIKAFKKSENLMGVNHVHVARAIERAHGIPQKGGSNAE